MGRIAGRVPMAGGDLAGISGDSAFDVEARDWYVGTYLEATTSVGVISMTTGARADRFGKAHATTVDPRLNVRVAVGRSRAIRYATGIYHKAPAPSYYDGVRGASELAPMRAVRHVIGYETGREAEGVYLRVEGYMHPQRSRNAARWLSIPAHSPIGDRPARSNRRSAACGQQPLPRDASRRDDAHCQSKPCGDAQRTDSVDRSPFCNHHSHGPHSSACNGVARALPLHAHRTGLCQNVM
jgi:hypothetical protein